MPEVKSVWRSRIVVDEDLLPRVAYDDETARGYAALRDQGHKFPPIVVFQFTDYLGDGLYLVDGSYRLWAEDSLHRSPKFKVEVEIHQGTRSEALWYAAGANQQHGLPLTTVQRVRGVKLLLADKVTAKKSDRQIAKQCGLDPKTVGQYRKELQLTLGFPESDQREGADGRTIDTANIGRRDTEAAGASAGGRSPAPSSGVGLDAPESTEAAPAPAEWPASIKDVILEGTKTLKSLASDCRKLETRIHELGVLNQPGSSAFHVTAGLERIRRLRLAITRAIPYCVCPECRAEGKPCNRCGSLGSVVRAQLDETEPTPNQIAQLELRGAAIGAISKAEAARQLDDLFAAESWQERRKLKINAEPPEGDF